LRFWVFLVKGSSKTPKKDHRSKKSIPRQKRQTGLHRVSFCWAPLDWLERMGRMGKHGLDQRDPTQGVLSSDEYEAAHIFGPGPVAHRCPTAHCACAQRGCRPPITDDGRWIADGRCGVGVPVSGQSGPGSVGRGYGAWGFRFAVFARLCWVSGGESVRAKPIYSGVK
jgi:hypothetical protein